jgi:hypothetical protein
MKVIGFVPRISFFNKILQRLEFNIKRILGSNLKRKPKHLLWGYSTEFVKMTERLLAFFGPKHY